MSLSDQLPDVRSRLAQLSVSEQSYFTQTLAKPTEMNGPDTVWDTLLPWLMAGPVGMVMGYAAMALGGALALPSGGVACLVAGMATLAMLALDLRRVSWIALSVSAGLFAFATGGFAARVLSTALHAVPPDWLLASAL